MWREGERKKGVYLRNKEGRKEGGRKEGREDRRNVLPD